MATYILNNPDEYIFEVTNEDIGLEENDNGDKILNKKREFILK